MMYGDNNLSENNKGNCLEMLTELICGICEDNEKTNNCIEKEFRIRNIHNQRYRLILIRHAERCSSNEDNPCLVTPLCSRLKVLQAHFEDCEDVSCKVQHCVSSKFIMHHYHYCMNIDCLVCQPERTDLEHKPLSSPALAIFQPELAEIELIQKMTQQDEMKEQANKKRKATEDLAQSKKVQVGGDAVVNESSLSMYDVSEQDGEMVQELKKRMKTFLDEFLESTHSFVKVITKTVEGEKNLSKAEIRRQKAQEAKQEKCRKWWEEYDELIRARGFHYK